VGHPPQPPLVEHDAQIANSAACAAACMVCARQQHQDNERADKPGEEHVWLPILVLCIVTHDWSPGDECLP
jgi:hypothetical protein